jgi:hypothetical protein
MTRAKMAGVVAQVIDHLHKALSSNSSTAKTKIILTECSFVIYKSVMERVEFYSYFICRDNILLI